MTTTCNQRAPCGQECTLSPRPHRYHVCRRPDCVKCHGAERYGPVRESARMDWATTALAVFGLAGTLAGLWLGVM